MRLIVPGSIYYSPMQKIYAPRLESGAVSFAVQVDGKMIIASITPEALEDNFGGQAKLPDTLVEAYGKNAVDIDEVAIEKFRERGGPLLLTTDDF